jgi:hypothetical protein
LAKGNRLGKYSRIFYNLTLDYFQQTKFTTNWLKWSNVLTDKKKSSDDEFSKKNTVCLFFEHFPRESIRNFLIFKDESLINLKKKCEPF